MIDWKTTAYLQDALNYYLVHKDQFSTIDDFPKYYLGKYVSVRYSQKKYTDEDDSD